MPKGQPFTLLWQSLYKNAASRRADLHTHSTFSDGLLNPSAIYEAGCKLGLEAIAITDHDTTAAHNIPTEKGRCEMIHGVEITCVFNEKVYHLLGYMINLSHKGLQAGLSKNREFRKARFLKLTEFIQSRKVSTLEAVMNDLGPIWDNPENAIGSRHLAQILVNQKRAHSIQNAYYKHLRFYKDDNSKWLTMLEACDLIHKAGGVSILAHPPENITLAELLELKSLGLDGIEIEYPEFKLGRRKLLKDWALKLDFCIGGGSDYHGLPPRVIGASSITVIELDKIKQRSEDNRQCFALC